MSAPNKPTTQTARAFRGAWMWIALALAVLAATVVWSQLNFRQRIRQQIAGRDGLILDAVAAMQHLDDQASDETLTSLADPAEQLNLALKVSRLRNVVGVRLFSTNGEFISAFPATITEAALPAADLAPLRELRPVSHYEPAANLAQYDLLTETNSPLVPLLIVEVPLRSDDEQRLAGVAQFLMDGSSIARQFAELDSHLRRQSVLGFLVGALILTTGLGAAFHRVKKSNRQLAERTQDLLRANRELALAARVNAVGAVTSHLIHGLKNPLSGLKHFVHRQSASGGGTDDDWQLALSTTQRMQEMVERVARVLREQQTAVEYELSLAELTELASTKFSAAARDAGVRFETSVLGAGTFSNHEADLILLILENVAQNAVEATPAGKRVRLVAAEHAAGVVFEIHDEGPGLSPEQTARLFTPGNSSKRNGSGIGLAISKQLAEHLGAKLELSGNSASGCAFHLAVPRTNRVEHAVEPASVARGGQPLDLKS